MHDTFASTIATIDFLHHLLCIRIGEDNLVDDVTLLARSLGHDGCHRVDIEVHSNQQRGVG